VGIAQQPKGVEVEVSRLYLYCALCGRQQADGLLSRAAWGHVTTAEGERRACPTCKTTYSDWEVRVVSATTGRVGTVIAPPHTSGGQANH
jgi:hypothetical protein